MTSLVSDNGPVSGGTVVTITGSGFTGATTATFDGDPGTVFSVDSDTQITVTSPARAVGTIDVVVVTAGGDSLPADFTYTALGVVLPTISSLVPDNGPVIGGTVVTITGSGFTGATGVLFDGLPGTAVAVDSDTQITVTSPAHIAGPVDVVVVKAGGNSLPASFTYTETVLVVPTITSLVPDNGPVEGGTVVTITGSGFTGATGATFDAAPGTVFSVDSDTQITVTTPAHIAGPVDVVVVKAGGNSLPGTFTYTEFAIILPTITSITPDNGPDYGGTVVTIIGSGFTGSTGATFGGSPGTGFTVVSDTVITVTAPPHAAGPVDVAIVKLGGESLPEAFTYNLTTTIISVTPDHGPEDGGATVTITGSCFAGATAVVFGNTPAASFTVVDDSTITAVSPAGVGTVDVSVNGSPLCGAGQLADGFTLQASALAATGATPLLASLAALLLLVAGAGVLFARRRSIGG
ncbi:MAG: IPT/TIG domain-containing protein [Burkholderiaceae bacterium]|nr:IPT/TIG domain-containing protein [Microbacteriaceae bacterium]